MKRRHSAFTLAEMLVTMGVMSVVGGVIYTVATEGLSSFANNASINRTYTDARLALFQVNSAIKSAGHNPILIDATGAISNPVASAVSNSAAGVRFYTMGNLPNYRIPSGSSTLSSLSLTFEAGQAPSTTPPILPGDLATIPLLGFQDTVVSTSGYTRSADGSGSITLNFARALWQNCIPALPVNSSNQTVPVSFVPTTDTDGPVYYTCLVFRQVAFIAVPNTTGGGASLRYYPQAMSTGTGSACGNLSAFNNSTAFNNTANFSVVTTIPSTVTDAALTPLKPFTVFTASPPTLSTSICATSPDYTNRNQRPGNSYTAMTSSMAARSQILLHVMPSQPF